MTSLNNGSECEDVINHLVVWAETSLPSSPEMTPLQLLREPLV
jgi:hypothetical protein